MSDFNEYPELIAWNDFKAAMVREAEAERNARKGIEALSDDEVRDAHDACYEMEDWDGCDLYAAELNRRGCVNGPVATACDDYDVSDVPF